MPDQKRTNVLSSPQWWDQPKKSRNVACALYNYAQAIETNSYRRRRRNAVLYRLVTGEDPPVSLGLWMSRRAASMVVGAASNFTKPYLNVIANARSVLANRIGTIKPWITVTPNNVEFSVREACEDVTDAVDAVFSKQDFYSSLQLGFDDAFAFGMAIFKVSANADEDDALIERVFPDEILIDETASAFATPSDLVQRRYMSRASAMATFGDTPEARAAIASAPSAFYSAYGTTTTNDYIAVLEAWKLSEPGTEGRHVLCLPNFVLDDDPFEKKRFPFVFMKWRPQMIGFWPNGAAFDMSGYQAEINDKVELIRACQRAMAYPRWLVRKGSGVTAKSLGARPGAIHEFDGATEPTPITPIAVNAEMYQDLATWENRAYAAAGLTQQQVQGQKQAGVTAAVALRMMVNVEDSRNKSLTIMLERATKEVGEQVIDVLYDLGAKVKTTGPRSRKIDFEAVISRADYEVGVYEISSLPSEPEGKAQRIEEMFANGTIDQRSYFRLQQMPDIQSYAHLATASADLVEETLDEICRTGKFIPPDEAYESPQAALKVAQAYYCREKRFKSPRPVLRALQQWMAVLADRIAHPNGQTLQPPVDLSAPGLGPAAVMPQSKAAGLPAPPPLQVSPTIAPPQQLAA